MTCRALAFGLVLESNHPLPDCPLPPPDSRPDLTIDLQPGGSLCPEADDELIRTLPDTEPEETPHLRVWYSATRERYRFCYADGVTFTISAGADRVAGTWPAPLTREDALPYLFGPVLGFVLRLRRRVCLHASAVAVAGRGVAFLAGAGFGKSTLAALFATRGHPVVTDDILVVRDEDAPLRFEPARARICLWPAAVEMLFGSPEALPRITPEHPTWDKRFLSLDGSQAGFQHQPLPAAVLYSARRDPAATRISIEPVTGREALLTLTSHAYSWYLLDATMRARDLDVMSRLLQDVPLRAITGARHESLSPAELYDFISDDLAALGIAEGCRA